MVGAGTAAIREREPAGYGEEIPDGALRTWGLDRRQKTKPGSILAAGGQQSVRG
jgi:hypothetical protein